MTAIWWTTNRRRWNLRRVLAQNQFDECKVQEAHKVATHNLTAKHFEEFEAAYGKDPNGGSKRKGTGEKGRFGNFHLSEIKERQFKLDMTWLKDESLEDNDDLPGPQDLAEASTELEAVVDDLKEIVELIEKEEGVEK